MVAEQKRMKELKEKNDAETSNSWIKNLYSSIQENKSESPAPNDTSVLK